MTNKENLQAPNLLDAIVRDNNEGPSDTAEQLRDHSLVHAGSSLLPEDFLEAVDGALVEALGHGLLRLKHHTTTHCVEGVVERHDNGTCSGHGAEGRDGTKGPLIVLVRVQILDLLEATQLAGTVDEGTHDGDRPPGVQTRETLLTDSRDDAVNNAVELALALAQVRCETGTGKVERVADSVGDTSSKTAGEELDTKALPKLGLAIVIGEHVVEGVIEGQCGTLLRRISQAIDHVTTPECSEALFIVHSREAVADAVVASNLSADDVRVGVHGLQKQLDAFHRGHDGLGHSSDRPSDHKIRHELLEAASLLLLLYLWFSVCHL